jgi:hypothetical protein
MQSQRKFKKAKRFTMTAQEFAIPFAQNVGSYTKAVLMCDNFAQSATANSKRTTDFTKDECRGYARTAGFYESVAGILRKTQVKMGVKPTPTKHQQETKGVKKDTADRRPETT